MQHFISEFMVAEVGNESWCIIAAITKIVESEENNPNVTLVCDDDAHKVNLCEYSSFFQDWSRWKRSWQLCMNMILMCLLQVTTMFKVVLCHYSFFPNNWKKEKFSQRWM